MKKCPLCKSIIRAKTECPICGSTLTYEPAAIEEKEHITLNRYSLLYLFKNIWFSVISCIIGVVVYIVSQPKIDYLFLMASFFALISLLVSVFHRKLSQNLTWKYSEEYIPYKIGYFKYVTGALSILFFILVGFVY